MPDTLTIGNIFLSHGTWRTLFRLDSWTRVLRDIIIKLLNRKKLKVFYFPCAHLIFTLSDILRDEILLYSFCT